MPSTPPRRSPCRPRLGRGRVGHGVALEVRVNAHLGQGTLDEAAFGANAAIWDAHTNDPEVASLMDDAGIGVMRYPGGSYSDIYHCKDHTAPGGYVAPGTGFDAFMETVQDAGAQPMITATYGTGSPEEAAAWVRYANVTNDYGVKRRQLDRHAGDRSDEIRIAMTDVNSGVRMNSRPNGLFAADVFMTALENDVFNIDWWNIHNGPERSARWTARPTTTTTGCSPAAAAPKTCANRPSTRPSTPTTASNPSLTWAPPATRWSPPPPAARTCPCTPSIRTTAT